MQRPLLISAIIEHARKFHGEREIVSRTPNGKLHRYNYGQAAERIYRLAGALTSMGVEPGDRVATLAWNDFRHFEIYYAVSSIGAVCHTINPRLSDEDLCYIVSHAEDRILFTDITFIERIRGLRENLNSVERYVAICAHADLADDQGNGWEVYEDLITGAEPVKAWPELDENSAAALCYTSGTTGKPRGVLYSHRSTVLHALSAALPDAFGVSSCDVILPVVPMFHVNAWALPYVAPMTGASLVLPGRFLDGASLEELVNGEKVTIAAGVPTVWFALLDHLQTSGRMIDSIERLVIGGSAVPASMIEIFEETYGIRVIQAWGMTELSPLGVVCSLKPGMERYSRSERTNVLSKQGRGIFGVELKIVDEDGEEQSWNGRDQGELMVRGPWVADSYFREPASTALRDGWFPTGDIVNIDEDGFLKITDRKKDVIKSGGEWISSIDLENALMHHTHVAMAAVIGIPDTKWAERPIAFVVARSGASLSGEDLLIHLEDRVAKWWLPDEIHFVSELPLGATGKVLKRKLRDIHASNTKMKTSVESVEKAPMLMK